jgi:catechol 2,3-dioxygenase-like lactoylglutathione lyase family enzyme
MQVNEILETCLYVDDLETAEQFYQNVLGLQPVDRYPGRHVFLRCGHRMLLLFAPQTSRAAGGSTPAHGADGPGHVAFAVPDPQMPAWEAHLQQHGVDIEQRITWPQGGHSLYFRDPAGNSLELASPLIWSLDPARTLGPP